MNANERKYRNTPVVLLWYLRSFAFICGLPLCAARPQLDSSVVELLAAE